MTDNPIRSDDWLSGLLGYDVHHVTGDPLLVTKEAIASASFVDAKVDVNNLIAVNHLEQIGFRLIDTNVQLTRAKGPASNTKNKCRFAISADETGVKKVAGSSFTKSRFHLDPDIAAEKADLVKAEWAGNFFKGSRGQWMVVAEDEGEVVGFLQLLKKSDTEIVIDLIAVQENNQGKGFAGSMVAFALEHCLPVPCTTIVGTQVSNYSSLGFYMNLGFRISSAQYVFHYHKK